MKRLTNRVDRRCRSGAVKGDENSRKNGGFVASRGSVRSNPRLGRVPEMEEPNRTWPNQAGEARERAGPGRAELHHVDEDRKDREAIWKLRTRLRHDPRGGKPGMVQRANRASRNTNPNQAGRSFSIEQPS